MITEKNWTDTHGEHFEVRHKAGGKVYQMKITRTPSGWSPSWDEVRARVAAAAVAGDCHVR